jgi:predicted O-linked N-acetylglucosamine transferase (SPINDLY family)
MTSELPSIPLTDGAPGAGPTTTLSLDAAFQLAQSLRAAGQLVAAERVCHSILRAVPDQPFALFQLGVLALHVARCDVAEQRFNAVLRQLPGNANAWAGLSSALQELGRSVEAERAARRAIQLNGANAQAHSALGRILLSRGRQAQAVASFSRAVELEPRDPTLMTGLLYAMVQDEAVDLQQLASMHRQFGKKFGAGLSDRTHQHANVRDPDKRLRVGFVSGDLRQHAVAYYIEPVWRELDRTRIEVFAYSNSHFEDSTSRRLKALVDHWRAVFPLNDSQLVERIKTDGIDILIDLSGHTVGNRLLAFARKPAPVQASWIGYPESTGLTAMDYHLCNVQSTPPGAFDSLYVEKLVHLHAAGPFEPDPRSPEVNPLPALQRGFVTFGSLNRLSKLGASVVPTWSRVLLAVPGSRLLLGNVTDQGAEGELLQRFAELGIAADRVTFMARQSIEAYLRLHHEIDVMLDTFPYTGGTTIKHALWMGVPTVTLAGQRRSERGGTANMARVGLDDWSVTSTDAYVERAVRAAADLAGLAALRAGMRERITHSPLCQAHNIARSLEFALRAMWRRWCAGLAAEAFTVSLEEALSAQPPVAVSLEPGEAGR